MENKSCTLYTHEVCDVKTSGRKGRQGPAQVADPASSSEHRRALGTVDCVQRTSVRLLRLVHRGWGRTLAGKAASEVEGGQEGGRGGGGGQGLPQVSV